MTVYEFYWFDPIKGYQLIGTLQERRRTPERITEESILKWGKKTFLGDKVNPRKLFYIRKTLNRDGHKNFF